MLSIFFQRAVIKRCSCPVSQYIAHHGEDHDHGKERQDEALRHEQPPQPAEPPRQEGDKPEQKEQRQLGHKEGIEPQCLGKVTVEHSVDCPLGSAAGTVEARERLEHASREP